MPDLTTLLSKFLNDLYSGLLGTTVPIAAMRTGDGTVAAPSTSYLSETGLGLYRDGAAEMTLVAGGSNYFTFSPNANNIRINSAGSFGWSSGASSLTAIDTVLVRDAANVVAQKNGTNAQALRLYQTTTGPVHNTLFMAAPTISSGFGTTPSIVAGSTAFCFRVNVGGGGAATSGVIGMPTAVTGWQAIAQDMTNNVATRVSATTTNSITLTAAAAWTANDIVCVLAVAF